MEEAYGVWRKNGLRRADAGPGCLSCVEGHAEPAGLAPGMRGPRSPGGAGAGTGLGSLRGTVGVWRVWKGLRRVTTVEECVKSKLVHLSNWPTSGIMAKDWSWCRCKDQNPLPLAVRYWCFLVPSGRVHPFSGGGGAERHLRNYNREINLNGKETAFWKLTRSGTVMYEKKRMGISDIYEKYLPKKCQIECQCLFNRVNIGE